MQFSISVRQPIWPSISADTDTDRDLSYRQNRLWADTDISADTDIYRLSARTLSKMIIYTFLLGFFLHHLFYESKMYCNCMYLVHTYNVCTLHCTSGIHYKGRWKKS